MLLLFLEKSVLIFHKPLNSFFVESWHEKFPSITVNCLFACGSFTKNLIKSSKDAMPSYWYLLA